MGAFKEKEIEFRDAQIQEIELLKSCIHQEIYTDEDTLYFPRYEKEVGGLLPHERRSFGFEVLIDLLRKK